MSKKTKILLTTLVVWAISLCFAYKADWFGNLTPPLHVVTALWYGTMSVLLGAVGAVMLGRYLYCSYNDEEMGIKDEY